MARNRSKLRLLQHWIYLWRRYQLESKALQSLRWSGSHRRQTVKTIHPAGSHQQQRKHRCRFPIVTIRYAKSLRCHNKHKPLLVVRTSKGLFIYKGGVEKSLNLFQKNLNLFSTRRREISKRSWFVKSASLPNQISPHLRHWWPVPTEAVRQVFLAHFRSIRNQKMCIKLTISKEKRIFASWKGVLWLINALYTNGRTLSEQRHS